MEAAPPAQRTPEKAQKNSAPFGSFAGEVAFNDGMGVQKGKPRETPWPVLRRPVGRRGRARPPCVCPPSPRRVGAPGTHWDGGVPEGPFGTGRSRWHSRADPEGAGGSLMSLAIVPPCEQKAKGNKGSKNSSFKTDLGR